MSSVPDLKIILPMIRKEDVINDLNYLFSDNKDYKERAKSNIQATVSNITSIANLARGLEKGEFHAYNDPGNREILDNTADELAEIIFDQYKVETNKGKKFEAVLLLLLAVADEAPEQIGRIFSYKVVHKIFELFLSLDKNAFRSGILELIKHSSLHSSEQKRISQAFLDFLQVNTEKNIFQLFNNKNVEACEVLYSLWKFSANSNVQKILQENKNQFATLATNPPQIRFYYLAIYGDEVKKGTLEDFLALFTSAPIKDLQLLEQIILREIVIQEVNDCKDTDELKKIQDAIANIPENLKKEFETKIKRKEEGLNAQTDQEQFNKLFVVSNFDEFVVQVREYCAVEGEFSKLEYFRLRTLIDRDILSTGRHKYKIFINEIGVNARIQTDKQFSKFILINLDKKLNLEQMFNYSANEYQAFLTICGGDEKFVSYAITDSHVLLAQDEDTTPPTSDNVNQRYNDIDQYNIIWSLLKEKDSKNFNEQFAKLKVKYQLLFIAHMVELLKQYSSARKKSYDLPACLNFSEEQLKGNLAVLLKSAFFPLLDLSKLQLGKSPVQINKAFEEMLPGGAIDEDLRKNIPLVFGVDVTNLTDDRRQNVLPELYYLDHLWAKLKKNSGGSEPREFERFEKFKQDLILMYEAIKKKARFGDKFTFLEFLQCLFDGDRADLKIIITAEKQENKTTNKQEDVLKVEIVGSNVDNFKNIMKHLPFINGKKTSFILSSSSLGDDSKNEIFLTKSTIFATFKSLTTGSPATTTTTAAEHGEGEVKEKKEITEATTWDTEEGGGDKGDDEHLPTAEETLSTQYKLDKISWGEVKAVELWSENSIGFIYNPIGFDVTIGGQTFKFEGDEADVFTLFFLELMKHDDVVSLYIDQLESASFPLDLSMLTDEEIVLSNLEYKPRENIKKFIAANRQIILAENPPSWLIELMGAITDKKNIIVVLSSSDEQNLEDYLKRFNEAGDDTVLLEEGTLAETPNPLDQWKDRPGFDTAMKFLFGDTFNISNLSLQEEDDDDDEPTFLDKKYKFTYDGREYELKSEGNWYYISSTHNGIDRTVIVRKEANTNAPSFFCRIDSVDIEKFTGEETFEFDEGVRMQVKENSSDFSTIGQPGLQLELKKEGDVLSINPASDPPFVKVVNSNGVEYLNYGRILIDQNNKADFRREGKNHLMSFIHPAFNKDKRNDEINNYINKIEDAQKKLEWLREQITELDNYIYKDGRLFYKDIDICTCTEEKLAEIKKEVTDVVNAKIAELEDEQEGDTTVKVTIDINPLESSLAQKFNGVDTTYDGKKILKYEVAQDGNIEISIDIAQYFANPEDITNSFDSDLTTRLGKLVEALKGIANDSVLAPLVKKVDLISGVFGRTQLKQDLSFIQNFTALEELAIDGAQRLDSSKIPVSVKKVKLMNIATYNSDKLDISHLQNLQTLEITEYSQVEESINKTSVTELTIHNAENFLTYNINIASGIYKRRIEEGDDDDELEAMVGRFREIFHIPEKITTLVLYGVATDQQQDYVNALQLNPVLNKTLKTVKFWDGVQFVEFTVKPLTHDEVREMLEKSKKEEIVITGVPDTETEPDKQGEEIIDAVIVDEGVNDIPLLEAGLVNYDDVRNAISQITIETDLTALLTQISKISGYETQQSFNISIIQKLLEIGVDPKDLAVHFKNHYVAGSEKTLKSPANEIFEGFSVKLGESEFGFAISQETKSVFIRDVFGDYKDTKNYVTYQLSPINNDTPIAEALATSFVDKLTSQYPNIADLLKPTEEGAQTKPEIFVSLNQYLIDKKSDSEELPSDELKIQTFTLYGELAQIQDKSTLSPAEQILWIKITQALDQNYVHPHSTDPKRKYSDRGADEKIRVGGIVLEILEKMQNASIVEDAEGKLICYSYDGKVYDAEHKEQQPIQLDNGWSFTGNAQIYTIGEQIYVLNGNSPITKSKGRFVAEKHGWTTLLNNNESLEISEQSTATRTVGEYTIYLPANSITDKITVLDKLSIKLEGAQTDLQRLTDIDGLHLFQNGETVIQATVENNDIKLTEIKPNDGAYTIGHKLYRIDNQGLKPVQAIEVQTPESVEVNLTSDNSKLELSSFTPTIRQEKLVEQRGRLSSLIGGLNSFTDKRFEAKNYLSMLKADGDRNFDVVNGAFAQIKQAFFTQLLQVLNQDEIPRDDLTNLVRSQARDLANKLPNWGVNDDNYGTYDEPSYAKVLCEGFVAGVVAEVIGQITQKAKIEISEIIQKGLSNGTLSKETIGENIWDEFVTNGIDRNGVNIKPDEEDATDFNLLTSPIELSIGDKVYKSVQEFKDAPPGKRYMTYDSSEGKKLATFDTGTYDVTENKKVDGTDLYELEVVSGVPETEKKYFYMEGERLVEKTLE